MGIAGHASSGVIRSRVAPALALYLLAPLVAEYLLGDFPLTALPFLIILAPVYGGAALLIREATRRAGRGWPTILLLALAFGLLLEGVVNQSLFNPDYAHAHLLDRGFIPALGIAGPWTLYVLTLHTVWSISVPILLVEEFTGEERTRPWLSRWGLGLVTILLVVAARLTAAFTERTYDFRASIVQLAAVVLLAAILVGTAFFMPRRRPAASNATAPSAWAVFAAAFVAASLFIGSFTYLPTWAVITLDLVLYGGMLLAVSRWSSRLGWGRRHRVALGTGALLTYAWHSFVTRPVVPASPGLSLVSHVVFAAAALSLLVLEVRALTSERHEREPAPA
jgi:hypothetical protein